MQVELQPNVFLRKPAIKTYLIVFVGYFLVLFLMRFFRIGINNVGQLLNPAYLLMLLGGILGMGIGIADRLVYAFVSKPEEEYSKHVQELVKQKKIKTLLVYLSEDQDSSRRLSTNNAIFLAVWVVLGLFLVTTTVIGFSRGLILGVGLSLVTDLYFDLQKTEALKQRLFWPIARPVTDQEMKITVYFFFGAFVLLSFMAV